ncbi:MAG: hypothetical protein ACK5P5_08375 [Pseudobdellovibrionaceae bacterium]
MLRIYQLIRFLQDSNPQSTPVRLAFYNYLKSEVDGNEPLSQKLLEDFFGQCLEYPHWLANKNHLGREVFHILQNINSFFVHQSFDFKNLRFPQDMQVFEIENPKDILQASERYIETLCGNLDKYRIVSDTSKRCYGLIARTDRTCEIHQLDRKFTLRDGLLQPLRKDIVLHYDADFNLKQEVVQCCEIAPYLLCYFKLNNKSLISGSLLRGYVFQKLSEFAAIPIEQCGRLEEYVRRLEMIFFEKNETLRPTPPNLSSETLELDQVANQKSISNQGEFENLISQAERALKTSFQEDKNLSLLVERFKTYVQSSTQ